MSVYVITGASKGLGFEFLKQVSVDPQNTVIGLVRDKAATEEKVAKELDGRQNVHILHGDLSSYASLKAAAMETTKLLGDRGVDYLISNGAYVPSFDAFDDVGALGDKIEELEQVLAELNQTNILGSMHLFNLFLPLVQKGRVKKVISLSSGVADLDLINDLEVGNSALYAAFKAALNVIVAKYNAQYKKDGVLFVSISPGVVDVGKFDQLTPAQLQGLGDFMGKIVAYAPHFKGPATVEDAARENIALWEKVSIDSGYGGAFVSHLGNKQWI
ncbi:putative short chain dehydrogenase [Boeremia exigua]|uniref:putative short chain dehydrogenase n=1 Tax=Boeremia exigua TaxID=749465 RepID=UPI001E8EA759|nr:putative short chain dehydrogenase [Boeremia exigua]KAH6612412.1 putative short chain dehydrogenase [Boeremia exigua]